MIDLPPVDPKRFAVEWAADQDVLERLAADGDNSAIARPVDVSFRGPLEALHALEMAAEELGFSVLEEEQSGDGDRWLFLERVQTTDAPSIQELTETCLRIEAYFGLEYDGWGCLAENGSSH